MTPDLIAKLLAKVTELNSNNIKRFERYGPWWMASCIVLERLPWRSATLILVWRAFNH